MFADGDIAEKSYELQMILNKFMWTTKGLEIQPLFCLLFLASARRIGERSFSPAGISSILRLKNAPSPARFLLHNRYLLRRWRHRSRGGIGGSRSHQVHRYNQQLTNLQRRIQCQQWLYVIALAILVSSQNNSLFC